MSHPKLKKNVMSILKGNEFRGSFLNETYREIKVELDAFFAVSVNNTAILKQSVLLHEHNSGVFSNIISTQLFPYTRLLNSSLLRCLY